MKQICPKCGNRDLHIEYIPKDNDMFGRAYSTDDFKKLDKTFMTIKSNGCFYYAISTKEFLQCHCRTCQYSWNEDTLDTIQEDSLKYLT